MAIEFQKGIKREQILIFFLVILVIFLVYSLMKEKLTPKVSTLEITPKFYPKIELQLEILDDPFFKSLSSFPTISPFEEKTGRDNPFSTSTLPTSK